MKKIDYSKIVYLTVILFIVCSIFWLFTTQSKMPKEYKTIIDSLTKVNTQLHTEQKKLDSAINAYQIKVDRVDYEIDHIKEKTTVVKEFHHEIIERINHYDATQVDSFFKARYNY